MKNVNGDLGLGNLMPELIQLNLPDMSIGKTACSLTSVCLPVEFTTHSRKIIS